MMLVMALHQREHDTTQSAVMSLLLYAGLFPDMVAAISERRVREGTGTPVQEDLVLVGFGNFATVSFKDLYEAMDLDRKEYGFTSLTEDADSRDCVVLGFELILCPSISVSSSG